MKIDVSRFRVKAGTKAKLKELPTRTKSICGSEDEYKDRLEQHVKQLAKLHELLYAADKYAVLLILQGMDAAGKDGVVKHVMSGVNPTGCHVTSFKQPSSEELEHDFLWRCNARLPRRGEHAKSRGYLAPDGELLKHRTGVLPSSTQCCSIFRQ